MIPSRSINGFRSTVLTSGGFQHPGMYECVFYSPLGSLESYPYDMTLPQRSFDIVPFSNWGPESNLQVRSSYGECSMTFVILQDWAERNYMERWMDLIIPPQKTISHREVGLSITQRTIGAISEPLTPGGTSSGGNSNYSTGFSSSTGNISIRFLNSQDKSKNNASLALYDAYPITITPTTFSSTPEYGIATFVVIFSFRDYSFS